MSSLDDDIARIAALRGKTAADYAARPTVRLTRLQVASVFLPAGPDLKAFDQLPQALRDWSRGFPNNTNAHALLGLLEAAGGDVAAVLKALPSPKPEPRFTRRVR